MTVIQFTRSVAYHRTDTRFITKKMSFPNIRLKVILCNTLFQRSVELELVNMYNVMNEPQGLRREHGSGVDTQTELA